MESPKQMGSDQVTPREGAKVQQQGSEQTTVRRDDKAKPAQMQATQFRDWASI